MHSLLKIQTNKNPQEKTIPYYIFKEDTKQKDEFQRKKVDDSFKSFYD